MVTNIVTCLSLICGSGSLVLVLFRRCVNSITATSVLQCQMTYQDRCRDNYRPWFTVRLRGAGGGAGTSIPRPFILNPHVFDEDGFVIKHAKKGNLIALIDSDIYTVSKFVTTRQLQLAVKFILSKELNAPDAPGVPAHITTFLNSMGKCTQHAFAKNAIVIGIGFADTNVE